MTTSIEESTAVVDTQANIPIAKTAAIAENASEKILKQVEFYFSDVNLPKDKFLQGEMKKNEEGWIDLKIICSFARMRALTEDISVVAASLKTSELVEISECGEKIRRAPAKPVEAIDSMKTGVFIRNFPNTMSLDDLQAFFAQGTITTPEMISAIRMRRHKDSKEFKGSVFLILNTEEEAIRVAALKTAKFSEEISLELADMLAFMEEQNAKAMARKDGKRKTGNETSVPAEPLTLEQVKGMLVAFENCPQDLEHRALRSVLATYGPIAFVEAVNAEGVMIARFKEACAAECIEKITAEAGLKVNDAVTLSAPRMTSDEEATVFLEKLNQVKVNESSGYHKKNFKRPRRN